MYIYVYICIYICVFIYIYVYIYIYMYIYIYICIYMYIYVYCSIRSISTRQYLTKRIYCPIIYDIQSHHVCVCVCMYTYYIHTCVTYSNSCFSAMHIHSIYTHVCNIRQDAQQQLLFCNTYHLFLQPGPEVCLNLCICMRL